jgi:hypothetical protein
LQLKRLRAHAHLRPHRLQGLLVHRSRLEVEVDEAAARRTAKLPSYMKPTASSVTKARPTFP